MAEKINDESVHIKFLDDIGEFCFTPICDILAVGVPIDDSGDDMKQVDDLLYVWREDKWVALS